MNFPVFDLHCDTASALLGPNMRSCGSLKTNSHHVDLDRAGALAGYAQCFSCFTPEVGIPEGVMPVQAFERQLATIHRELEKNQSMIRQAFSASEIRENQTHGMMSALLTIEGPAGFDYDPALLQDLYLVGFRISTLGWNGKNPLTGSHATGGGLTDQGREYVAEAQRLGMLVDVSHISDEGFWDIIDITQRPVVATHSNSRSVCDHSRNLTDDMFRAICQTGGVAGINVHKPFVGGSGDLDALCDHVFHFLELDPEGSHIALGADLDGTDTTADGFTGVESYPAFACRLLERGLREEDLLKLFWNNAIGVIEGCCI